MGNKEPGYFPTPLQQKEAISLRDGAAAKMLPQIFPLAGGRCGEPALSLPVPAATRFVLMP